VLRLVDGGVYGSVVHGISRVCVSHVHGSVVTVVLHVGRHRSAVGHRGGLGDHPGVVFTDHISQVLLCIARVVEGHRIADLGVHPLVVLGVSAGGQTLALRRELLL